LTFDGRGISSHPNHVSLYRGVQTLLSIEHFPRAYALRTTSILSKYIGQAAGIWERSIRVACVFVEDFAGEFCGSKEKVTFVSGIEGYVTALRAMMQHRTQLVWFRWLYVLFSRYMWVNDWEEIVAIN